MDIARSIIFGRYFIMISANSSYSRVCSGNHDSFLEKHPIVHYPFEFIDACHCRNDKAIVFIMVNNCKHILTGEFLSTDARNDLM